MKKLFIAILFAGLFAVSCNKDPLTLDGTLWDVVRFEDIFNGSVVHSEVIEGDIVGNVFGSDVELSINIPRFGLNDEDYGPADYRIVKYTNHELVFDLWYYEYDDYKESDCEYIETFKGKRMYYAYYLYGGQTYYDIVYFVGPGLSVDCGYETPEGERPYYYDTTRIYCQR